MASLSGLGIGLSLVFGFIFLGIVAEIYHLVWWKKKKQRHGIKRGKVISTLFCCKNPNSVDIEKTQPITCSVKNPDPKGPEPELEFGQKGFGEEEEEEVEENLESELKRLHNLCGPPRFLFTIKEETKEDLESDDGKSRGDKSRKGSRTRSLSDLVYAIDTPISLTPLASPKGNCQLESYGIHGFNPLFESVSEVEIERLRSSPPPKLKFLRDAEEKLMKKLRVQTEKRAVEDRDGSFIRIIVRKN